MNIKRKIALLSTENDQKHNINININIRKHI